MSEFTNRIFGKALNFLLENYEKFSSQKDLAISAGVSEGVISNLINGTRNYGEKSHLKVANAFGYRLDDFYRLGLAIEEKQAIGEIDPDKQKLPKEIPPFPETKEASGVCQQPPEHASQSVDESSNKENGNNYPKVLHLEHGNLVRAFRDPQAGYEINKALIEIERIDPEEFDRIKDFVHFSLRRVRAKKIAPENSK